MKGKFIVFEGTDGSGKATQVELLQNHLEKKKIPHSVIAFPRYTDNPYGRLISHYLKGEFGDMHSENVYLMSLAFAGDRFLAKRKIEKWLKKGMVIADRYVSSNKAHMSARLLSSQRSKFIAWLDNLEYKINKIPKEDLTIFLYVSPQIARQNLKGKGSDMHEESLAHLKLSSQIYLKLAKQNPSWVVFNCTKNNSMRNPEEIHQEILQVLMEKGILNS